MKHINILLSLLVITFSGFSQSVGDTIIVQSLHHGSAVRDTTVNFPTNSNLTYSKILMKYNMRCKDGKVSDGGNRNKGCGEWDYSCNTYIHDESKVDSLLTRQLSHTISNFSGDTFYYTTNPVNTYYVNYQTSVGVDSIISETQSTVGSGSLSLKHTLATDKSAGKSRYLFTASELTSAGLATGNIAGLMLNVLSSTGQADFLRIKIKSTGDSALTDTSFDASGFSEVYFRNTQFTSGLNRLQFHSPYAWNGTDNLIIELSFTNNNASSAILIAGHSASANRSLHSAGDKYFYFDGANYIEANQYKGIGGSNPRTIEAWIKTTSGGQEIVSWGRDASSSKWNIRLESTGQLRVEVNGGFRYGTTDLRDNEWHHIAVTCSGSNVNQSKLYVDGVLETNGSTTSKSMNTDIVNGINVRISRGTNNRYFKGIIDDVRIWDTVLTANELMLWKYRSVNASHPKYSHLELAYSMNEGNGSAINDSSMNSNDATIKIGNQWAAINGSDLFKELSLSAERPNMTFLQGSYVLTNTIDTILDTIANFPHSVVEYQIFPKTGTTKSDSIASTQNYYYQAGYEYVIDTNGLVIDSIFVASQGFAKPVYLDYFRRYPMRFEIMSFVTPYGIGINFGKSGHTWTFDVTDFAPILKGDKRLTMEWGGQWQEEMDIQFYFIVGTPPRDVIDIDQLWRVTKPSYTNIQSNLSYEPRNYKLNSNGEYFHILSAITGHGQEGEFIPRNHIIDVNNGGLKTSWQVWKFCSDNPIYPQGGTWIYDRAGWCPGAPTDVKRIDLTSKVSAGSTINVDYDIQTASGSSNYIVSNQLVTYGGANFSLDAAIVDILSPSSAIEYNRTNYICGGPKVIIQNTGSATLTSLDINYWINGAAAKQNFEWTGSLDFMETEEVELPGGSSLWKDMKASDNRFFAQVANPNSGSDEYAYNNGMKSDFEIPEVLPDEFIIQFKTNNAANENTYYVYDQHGNVIFSKSNFANNTTYKDTMRLGSTGCYQIRLDDSDGDGIDFWANNDGSGYFWITDLTGKVLYSFEKDFGSYYLVNFTTNFPLTIEEIDRIKNGVFNVYPNPAENSFTVEVDNADVNNISIYNSSGQQIDLRPEVSGDKLTFDASNLAKGIYLIQVMRNDKAETKRVVIN